MLEELRASLELDTIKEQEVLELTDEDIASIISTSIESSNEAITALCGQIISNINLKQKYGVKTVLEAYDFTEEEIKVAIEKYGEDKTVQVINSKFLGKVGKFFKNLLNSILRGIKRIWRLLTDTPFVYDVKEVIDELVEDGLAAPSDAVCPDDVVAKYISDYKNRLKIAMVRDAKTLKGAQFKIISDYYATGKSLEFVAKLSELIATSSVLLDTAIDKYLTTEDKTVIESSLKGVVYGVTDVIKLAEKYETNIPYYQEWLSLPEIKKLKEKSTVVLIPMGCDGKELHLLDFNINRRSYDVLKDLTGKSISEMLSALAQHLMGLWHIDIVKVPLEKIKLDPTKVFTTGEPLQIKDMQDLIDKHEKISSLIKTQYNKITDDLAKAEDKVRVIRKDNPSSRNEMMYVNYDVEKILAMLINFRSYAYSEISKVHTYSYESIIRYFGSLPEIVRYVELSKKCYQPKDTEE